MKGRDLAAVATIGGAWGRRVAISSIGGVEGTLRPGAAATGRRGGRHSRGAPSPLP